MLRSARLDEFYAELMVELRFYLTVLSLEDREFEHPDEILAEHRVILEAIESGDTATAVQQVRAHIESNARRVIEILNGRELSLGSRLQAKRAGRRKSSPSTSCPRPDASEAAMAPSAEHILKPAPENPVAQ